MYQIGIIIENPSGCNSLQLAEFVIGISKSKQMSAIKRRIFGSLQKTIQSTLELFFTILWKVGSF